MIKIVVPERVHPFAKKYSEDEGEDETIFIHRYSGEIIQHEIISSFEKTGSTRIGHVFASSLGSFIAITYQQVEFEIMTQYIRESKLGCIVGVLVYKKQGFWGNLFGKKLNDRPPQELFNNIFNAIKRIVGEKQVIALSEMDYDNTYARGDISKYPVDWGIA